MRTSILLATLVAGLGFLATHASAGELISNNSEMNYSLGSGCDTCGHGHHGRHCGRHGCGLHGRRRAEGLDKSFNCGCQGSYKFPVPPQYTYFWPGSVYSQQLMTDYHSPWRFPPLKPYTEETLTPMGAEAESIDGLRPVANLEPVAGPTLRPGQLEPMSSMMERYFR